VVVEVPLGGSFAAEAFLRETAKADAAAGGGATLPQVVVLQTAGVVWGAPDDEEQQVRYYYKSLPNLPLEARVSHFFFLRHFFFPARAARSALARLQAAAYVCGGRGRRRAY
jgi:hypothetical protein